MPAEFITVANRLQGTARQRNPGLLSAGQEAEGRFSHAGQLFSAGWREELYMAGHCYAMHVGTLTTGADVGLITGGGAGTTIDSDQPEAIVGVLAGTYLIPLEVRVAVNVDLDADAEFGNIALFVDTTQAPPATATATTFTPVPLLGGGPGSNARAFAAVTADITDPVMSVLLDYATVMQSQTTAASISNQSLRMEYRPVSPSIFKGPCSLVLCWGGTAAVTGMASIVWAEVPAGRFESQ